MRKPQQFADQNGRLTRQQGIPVTSLARTIVDLAGTEHPNRVDVALQAALRAGLLWPDLDAAVAELDAPGRPGIALVRSLAEQHRGRPAMDSGLEARVLRILLAAGLPEPRRQVQIRGDGWVARVDFLYDDVLLILEIEGAFWHESPADVRRDKLRSARLAAAGYRVLPLSEDLIRRSPDELVRLVLAARRRRAA